MSNIQQINESSLNEYFNSNKKILIDVWAPWCGPCKQLLPILEDVNTSVSEEVLIVKLNADENMDFCKSHSVRNIPTLLLFENGVLKNRMSGVKTKNEIIEFTKS